MESSSVVDTVELDASTDPELPQPLLGLLVQAGGAHGLSIECQLQPPLLAQEQHLGRRPEWVVGLQQTLTACFCATCLEPLPLGGCECETQRGRLSLAHCGPHEAVN